MSSKHDAPGAEQAIQRPSAADRPAVADWGIAELQHKLDTLPAIEQAKGILMGRFQMDPGTAFQVLVRWSQTNNVKVRVICETLTAAVVDADALEALVGSLQHQTFALTAGEVVVLGRPAAKQPGLVVGAARTAPATPPRLSESPARLG